MAIEDKIMGWMKNLGNLIVPGEGGEKADLFASEASKMMGPLDVKNVMESETFEQTGGFDKGLIDVITDKLEVVEYKGYTDKEMTEVVSRTGKDLVEASGETGSGDIISSFIENSRNSGTGTAEIELQGQTTDGQPYNFTLLSEPGEDGKPKFFLYSGGDTAELEMDQFVTIANNIDEKLASVEGTRQSQDRWSPESFRHAWEQIPTVTVGEARSAISKPNPHRNRFKSAF